MPVRYQKNTMHFLQIEPLYVISLEEIIWGAILIAITMGIHGFGMLAVLRVHYTVVKWMSPGKSLFAGIVPIIFASCIIIIVHLSEVVVWSLFFVWKGSFPNASIAFYFSLNEYTTVGSKFDLPLQWRLLEGMIAAGGLLSFAWSTGVLFTLAKEFQDQWILMFNKHRQKLH